MIPADAFPRNLPARLFFAAAIGAGHVAVAAADWGGPAPEDLPQVTVRYESAKQDVLVVEGAGYRVRTRREPAEIIAVEVNGTNVLSAPLVPGFLDDQGVRYRPQRSGIPGWETYQGPSYKPARNAAARFNVFQAGPYYWDAHVLDLPLVPETDRPPDTPLPDGEVVQAWSFEKGVEQWGGDAHQCSGIRAVDGALKVAYDGDDPYFFSPPVNEKGPLAILLHLRSDTGGTAQLYYTTAGAGYSESMRIPFNVEGGGKWQEIRIPWAEGGDLQRFRIDPPGNAGTLELDTVALRRMDPSVLRKTTVVRGEIVFHAFADRLNIEFRVDPEQTGVVPVQASWTLPAPGLRQEALGDRRLVRLGAAGMLGPPRQTLDGRTGRLEAPLNAASTAVPVPRCWWVLRPGLATASAEELFRDELDPLPPASFNVQNGRYLGYDAAAGLYVLEAIPNGFNFNSTYDNPNRRIEIGVAIRGDAHERRILCKSVSHVGMLPATVLADAHGFMLPTPVLSCKNFAGEREEPDDSAYGNAFFPIHLSAREEKRFKILHLFQNWGDHMLKQVSSIRFFHSYWHLSTGVSESTCFTIPWMKLNGVFVRIPDYRPYSGPFWPSQPQHDCKSWPGLLQYRAAHQDVRLLYEKTVFESITPNLAHFTMHFRSSDGAARATATVMEIPQGDQMRTFLKIRYDWERDVTIEGDATRQFRWLNINDKQHPTTLVYLNEADTPVAEAISPAFEIAARALGRTFPFLGSHGMPGSQGTSDYNSMVLLRSFAGRLAGKDQDRVFFSARYGKGGGNFWLTSEARALALKAGDFIEAELMLVPHANGTEPLVVPERERRYYGTEGPALTVRTGRALSEFPATVAAQDEVIDATLKGGSAVTPLIAGGFNGWGVPLLWVNGIWQNQQAHGGDGYQVNPDGDGKYRFTFLVKQRQGHPCNVIVTRADCSTGISRLVDRSGFLELQTDAAEGVFSLKAPALFGPGVNTVDQAAPAVGFSGAAAAVRQVPLHVEPVNQRVSVHVTKCSETEVRLTVSDAATLTFTALTPAAPYQLTVDGKKEVRRTPLRTGALSLSIPAGEHGVALMALPRSN